MTQPTPAATPVNLPDRELARELGERLRAHGLCQSEVLARMGVREIAHIAQLPHAERQACIAAPDPLNTLLRLFYFGLETPRPALDEALTAACVDKLVTQGLLSASAGGVRSRVQVYINADTITASDPPTTDALATQVMGIGGTTLLLSDIALRLPFEDALDMGTGAGLLAVRAAAHCRRVVATDISPRAASFARFNADLNARDNVEAVSGDLFSTVSGRTFDFIFSNPPYVISPETRVSFRDSGVRGDEFCKRLAREAARRLNPRGWFQMVCEWPHIRGTDVQQMLAAWFDGCACDVLVQRIRSVDPASSARHWLSSEAMQRRTDPNELARQMKSWVDFYIRQGFEAISTGVITMRRLPPGGGRPPWFRLDDAFEPMVSPAGKQILNIFRAQDFLHDHPGALLSSMYHVNDDVRLHQELRPHQGQWSVSGSKLTFAEGFTVSIAADAGACAIVHGCNARRTGADLVGLAVAAGAAEGDAEQTLRTLIARAVLLPPAS